ncbi:MAG: SAM-dependent chlorinase/fluorinase [Candidatus Heimdallarchaeota archaeon]|nr:MAG: SAM-dependent chlorinase/fluorinase [Candidatus Heimdallarchaeota archaeon]
MNPYQPPLIVLMTDFGNDPYTGVIKGRILQINPSVNIISLTNHIQNHDIRQGAFILFKSYKYFPHNTIFLIVVDPGVGGSRKAIGAHIKDYYFIGPDNGVLSPILSKFEDATIVEIPIPDDASYTFHGRDVFAPAAGILSQTYLLTDLGSQSTLQTPLRFFWDPRTSSGEVIFIDHFGNIVTNLPASMNLKFSKEYLLTTTQIEIIVSFRRSYFEGSDKNPFLLANSFNTLEIALRGGKASDILDISPGDRIQIHLNDN